MDHAIHQGAAAELWQALVREAGGRIGFLLDEYRESYLVFVLLQRQCDPFIQTRIQALNWFHAQQQMGSSRTNTLREIGDDCLIIAGMFPGLAHRRRVGVNYYIELGQGAYHALSETHAADAGLFHDLAMSYHDLVRTLRALREPRGGDPRDALENHSQMKTRYAAQDHSQHIH